MIPVARIHAWGRQRNGLQLQRDKSTSGFILHYYLCQLVSIDYYGSTSHGSSDFSQWVTNTINLPIFYVNLIYICRRIYAKILETRKLRERCRIKATNNIPLVLKKTNQTTDNQIEDNDDEGIAPVAVTEMASVVNQPNSTQEASSLQPQNNQASKRHEAMSTKDFKMARILCAIVIVFFVCHLPR